MSPQAKAKLLSRHDRLSTIHGMRVTPELKRWIDDPRKWISLTAWSGQNFVAEDR